MPLPNGVDPFGVVQAICRSAAWLGNRGELHDAQKRLVRTWKVKEWLTCQMSYKGWNRKPLMKPGQYTELFFLDEATALSAGHRPCGMCRRQQFTAFKSAWLRGNGLPATTATGDLDIRLHSERTNRGDVDGWQRVLESLPTGVMVEWNGRAHLWNGKQLREWTPKGYAWVAADIGSASITVRLCTPPSVVNAIAAGYPVQVHPSALVARTA